MYVGISVWGFDLLFQVACGIFKYYVEYFLYSRDKPHLVNVETTEWN